MKKSGIELHSIISDACAACLAYELDTDTGHLERYFLMSYMKESRIFIKKQQHSSLKHERKISRVTIDIMSSNCKLQF